jgi:hypothetical protein
MPPEPVLALPFEGPGVDEASADPGASLDAHEVSPVGCRPRGSRDAPA